ncbi:MAG TPA: DUF4129 domain-containing protein [Mucilaginibacter sp.]|jgi:hypothetical protein|nr:DUF4129 domain-containing protein [Mucilaginibacter sp.]
MRRVLIVLVLLLVFGRTNTFAVGKKSVAKPAVRHTLVSDTGKLTVRRLDSAALNRYSRDPDFNYTHERTEQQMSWWERLWNRFWRWVDSLFPKFSGGGNVVAVIKFLLIAAFAFLIIWLITRLFKIDLLRLFGKKKNDDGIPYSEQTENIHEINFDEAINKALHDRNYRLAVRLLYLRSLKQLNDAGLIHWRMEKTNLAYLNELENPEYKRLFGALTVRFEYVWYGDFPINNEVFQNIDSLFRDFNSRLK